ncbi:L-threonylcarbamoyladenylate synthase [Gilvimarinus sp. SDUM040013]|uniref:L-threonylcarbamoyladenylate synthase n=1 Tax=Gilvimarinus gilvus TaxID=3058038 RepID=A0ABU4S341_9GAMM|nr:L-threonylcarbamoyladenylate synthase [Gilvimarinus sp. SDUM040013]MDO3386418.1 L-threonylcarbamoyladenylate synthase [Gilvimarinus sp. SDUM040013]MDX6849684.1 L-threonylcarbamoyladenylate synthase [Gilvimarinus sp. SDUM040013]
MAQFFQVHPDNPQPRLISQAVDIVRSGGIIAYPTDSAYALGCHIGDKMALDRIRMMRKLDKNHNFTLMCRDLSEIATYARVDNQVFRLLKTHTPGPYTFILEGTSEVPRRLRRPKRKTIGLRVPDNKIALALLEELNEPLMSSTLLLPGDEFPLTDPYDIRDTLEHQVELIIDGGFCGLEPTTVVGLTDGTPELIREGKGDFSALLAD